MGTKSNPSSFDCYANAKPDEPMFVLLGRDPVASLVVKFWAKMRIATHLNVEQDIQIEDALKVAGHMADYAMGNMKAALVSLAKKSYRRLVRGESTWLQRLFG